MCAVRARTVGRALHLGGQRLDDRRCAGCSPVGETDAVEDQLTLHAGRRREAFLFHVLAILADDLADALERDEAARHLHDQAAQVTHGPDDHEEHPGIGQIRAHGNRAGDRHVGARAVAGQHLEAAQHVRDGPVHAVHEEQTQTALVLAEVGLLKLAFLKVLAGERLDHAYTGQVLLESGRQDGFLFLILLVGVGDKAEEEDRDRQDDRDDDDREQRQLPVEQVDGGEVDDEQEEDAATFDGLAGEEAAQRVHVRRRALEQFAGLCLVVIGERQALDVVQQVVAQPLGDAFGGVRRQDAADKGEAALPQRQGDVGGGDGPQRPGAVALRQIAVHKVLHQEQRHGACEGAASQGKLGGQIGQPIAGHKPPDPAQATADGDWLEVGGQLVR